jgi:hypothetical protein
MQALRTTRDAASPGNRHRARHPSEGPMEKMEKMEKTSGSAVLWIDVFIKGIPAIRPDKTSRRNLCRASNLIRFLCSPIKLIQLCEFYGSNWLAGVDFLHAL